MSKPITIKDKLEFTFFDGVTWEYVTKEITAISRIQLMRAFLNETEFTKATKTQTVKEVQKNVWNEYKNFIRREKLTFPIINNLSNL